jgi:hypothetical protein
MELILFVCPSFCVAQCQLLIRWTNLFWRLTKYFLAIQISQPRYGWTR